MPAFVACECLIAITFLSSLDPDQALQSAVPDLVPHCVISKCVSNIYTLSPYFCVILFNCLLLLSLVVVEVVVVVVVVEV